MQIRSVPQVRLRPLSGTDVSLLRGALIHEGQDASWIAASDLTQHLRSEVQQRRSWALVGCAGPLDRAICIVIGTAIAGASDAKHNCVAKTGDIEISYWTHPDFRRRGLTRVTVDQAVAQFGQELRPGCKLIAHADVKNHASRSILDNLSTQQSLHHDSVCFSLQEKVN